MYLQRYKMNLRELQFSEKYQRKEVESNAWCKLRIAF
jgi:hypothetical protein